MYASKCILWVFLVACAVGANGDVLMSWGDGTPETDFTWFPDENRLIILHGNGLNYKFWVHDGSEEPGTGVINNITVHQDATGDFSILIEHPDGYAGARDGWLTFGAPDDPGYLVHGFLTIHDTLRAVVRFRSRCATQ